MILHDTLVSRTLLSAAHQRDGVDERGCRYVLDLLGTATDLRAALHRELADLDLTELSLGVLVVLYALIPTPSTPADLATHTGATRSAMTEVIDRLQAREFVRRQRDTYDRRLIYIHLTETGCAAAETALRRFLEAAGRMARHVEAKDGETLLTACAQIREGSA